MKKFTTFEIVFITVVSVALGVSFWGWTFFYEVTKPILKLYGLNYLTSGFWILASVFLSGIIRKPGVAILASIIAAAVEAVFTQWGMMSVVWGLVQGIGAEIVFLAFMYKRWDVFVLILASIVSSIFSYTLDYFMYGYSSGAISLQITQVASFVVSSIFLSGILAHILIRRLHKIGALNKFLVANESV
jgi:energy-coupling factor transport system substrate-specific component